MKKRLDQLGLQPSSYNKPWFLAKHKWLVGYLQRQLSGRMAAPIDPTPYLSHRPVTAPTHKCSVFLFGHLFSYKNCGGRRDVITKSEAPKEKSEEAEGKTMVKTPFLQFKTHMFFDLSGIL